ncbi:hypothetical protein KPH14_002901 [Odynerus spinipes]|uniref:Uncharacterized protein n=1 Tax=Odynerus spinipes TaxID=1348599 RepID=A0AAD9RWX8_9HYME|nr:hypothetical protein KPH14_002901 [Odynerus spinipes]
MNEIIWVKLSSRYDSTTTLPKKPISQALRNGVYLHMEFTKESAKPVVSRPNNFPTDPKPLKMKTLFLFFLLIGNVLCAPWLDILLGQGSYGDQRSNNYLNQRYRQRQGRGGKERWKEICRTINPNPFAFPGRVPYPAAPVCPW